MNVAVGQSKVANHSVVFDGFRKLIIDPNYASPIYFEVLYTDGKPDEQKWKNMFKKLDYKFFHRMQQVYSIDSRFCVHGNCVQPANIVAMKTANIDVSRVGKLQVLNLTRTQPLFLALINLNLTRTRTLTLTLTRTRTLTLTVTL